MLRQVGFRREALTAEQAAAGPPGSVMGHAWLVFDRADLPAVRREKAQRDAMRAAARTQLPGLLAATTGQQITEAPGTIVAHVWAILDPGALRTPTARSTVLDRLVAAGGNILASAPAAE